MYAAARVWWGEIQKEEAFLTKRDHQIDLISLFFRRWSQRREKTTKSKEKREDEVDKRKKW